MLIRAMTRGLWPGVSFAQDNFKTDISMYVGEDFDSYQAL